MLTKIIKLFSKINTQQADGETFITPITSIDQLDQLISKYDEPDTNSSSNNTLEEKILALIRASEIHPPKNRPFFNKVTAEEQTKILKEAYRISRERYKRTKDGTISGAINDVQIYTLFFMFRWNLKDAKRFFQECAPKLQLTNDIVDDYISSGSVKIKDACYLLSDLDPMVFEHLEKDMDSFYLNRYESVQNQLCMVLNETDAVSKIGVLIENPINLIVLADAVRVSHIETKSILKNKLEELTKNNEIEIKKVICREIEISENIHNLRKLSYEPFMKYRNNLIELLAFTIKIENIKLERRPTAKETALFLSENTSLNLDADMVRGRLESFDRNKKDDGNNVNFFSYCHDIQEAFNTSIPILKKNIPNISASINKNNVINITIKPYASNDAEPTS